VDRVAQTFQRNEIFLEQDRSLIFVCGGTHDSCVRNKFMRYALHDLREFRFFEAESAQKDFYSKDVHESVDLVMPKDFLGVLSDCTIIFPESPGSFAELGYIAKDERIRKTALVVNDADKQGTDSFISLGPIALIDQHSCFGSTIQIAFSHAPVGFNSIGERLISRLKSVRRPRFNYRSFNDLMPNEQIFVLMEIISILGPLPLDEIITITRRIFINGPKKKIVLCLSFLIGVGYVERCGDYHDYFSVPLSAQSFLSFARQRERDAIRLDVVDFNMGKQGKESKPYVEAAA
jgi:hypothetical protein